ncbi:MAG: type II secretion system protein [Phycisphaerales bacterium]
MTLVETIVVMLIVGILIGITIPVIRSVAVRRHDALNLSNMRATMVDFVAYAAAHDGDLPNPGLPNRSQPDDYFYFDIGGTPAAADRYTALQFEWPRVLTKWLGSSHAHWHSTFDDLSFEGTVDPKKAKSAGYDLYGQISEVHYSHTMFSAAEIWTMPTIVSSIEIYKAFFKVVNLAEVRSASGKGVLVNRQRPAGGLFYMAFADGSASLLDPAMARPQAAHPLSFDPNRPGHPGMSTLDGYLGLDY